LFRRSGSDETIFHRDETIFRLPSRTVETVRRYENTTERREFRRQWMRAFSFILVFVFVLAGPSMAGSVESGLPGIGTFAYGTAPVAPASR
jgi:hypothetical protein